MTTQSEKTTHTKQFKIVSASKMNVGDTFTGNFAGVIELQYGDGYELVDNEGKSTVLAGAKRLGYALEKIPVGSEVTISYKGKEQVQIKTGKYAGKTIEAHQFDVSSK